MMRLNNNQYSPFLGVGEARGGMLDVGGVTWQDFKREYTPLLDFHQVFGHTYNVFPRYLVYNESGKKQIIPSETETGKNQCMDTGLEHILKIDIETGDYTIIRTSRGDLW